MMRLVSLLPLLVALAGCGTGQSRQGTAEVRANATVATVADVQAEATAIKLVIADESKRITDTTQNAVVAVSKVDNSSSDKFVNRTLAIGAVLSYVLGKVAWTMAGRVKTRMTKKA